MSMYGMLFGKSKHSTLLLSMLGLSEQDFYRFRDCYLDAKGRIAVYTRGGGGNRGCYCDDHAKDEERTVDLSGGGDKHAPGCVVPTHHTNRKHPAYLLDDDDDFDSTYATFYFRIPETVDRGVLIGVEPELARDEVWTTFLSALRDK